VTEEILKGQRVLVGNDLGEVRQGDYLILVGNVVVSLDTSRRPTDPLIRRSEPPLMHKKAPSKAGGKPRRMASMAEKQAITAERVLELVQQHQPVGSMRVSDLLNIPRNSMSLRARVSYVLTALRDEGRLTTHGGRVPTYSIPAPDDIESASG
jgi:predicted transcriptional regulator